MATFDVAAAKAAGYSDAEIAQFMTQAQAAPAPPAASAPPPDSTAKPGSEYDPSLGGGTLQFGPWDTHVPTPQWLERGLAGAGRGLVHTADSVGNLFGLVPDSTMENLRGTDAPLMATTAGKVGNLVGEAAATAPLGGGIAAGADLAAAKGAGLLARPLVKALMAGGAQGLATADPGSRLADTATGIGAGGLAHGAGALVSKLANGLTRTPAAQRLLDQGVDLTPGQMNPQGVFNQFEQALDSVGWLKQAVEPTRDAAEHSWQAKAIGLGAAPGAPPLKPSANIHDLLQQAYDSYGPLYQQAHGFPVSPVIMRTAGPDIPLSDAFKAAAKAPGVPQKLQKSEAEWLKDRLTQLPQNPQSEDLLQLRSDIRARARDANLKTDVDSGHVAAINSRAEQRVTDALNSQLPPQPLAVLRQADSNYGNYKTIENAVASVKDNLAGLTPTKLSQAIYNSVRDPAYARGAGGALRQWAQDGAEVFQNVSPPTGARNVTLGSAALLGLTHPWVAIPAATGALGMTSTALGRRLAQGATAPQRFVQDLSSALQARFPPTTIVGQAGRALAGAGGAVGGRLATGAATPVAAQTIPQALAALLAGLPGGQKTEAAPAVAGPN
jgi:hypothetical protein